MNNYNLEDFSNWLKISMKVWYDSFVYFDYGDEQSFFSFPEWVEREKLSWDNLNSLEWLKKWLEENNNYARVDVGGYNIIKDNNASRIIEVIERYKEEKKLTQKIQTQEQQLATLQGIQTCLQQLEQEKAKLETKIIQQKNLFNQAWNKKLELEKLKSELINKENKGQAELLTAFLEAQEQITRIKSENSSLRLISLVEKQLSRTKEKLKKEKINEEKLEIICQLQEETIKLQIELGIEEEIEKYEAQQVVPPRRD